MLKKILMNLILISSFSLAMSASMVETVSKDKLGCIKGLGVKRVEAIVIYRKSHEIDTLEELLNIRGIGKGILSNIKNDTQKKSCTKFSTSKKTGEKKKKAISAE